MARNRTANLVGKILGETVNVTTVNVTTVVLTTGQDVSEQANNAYGQANLAYTQANSAFTQANNAYGQANNAYGQANLAFTAANNARVTVFANNGAANATTQIVNFVNTSSILVTVSNTAGNANIAFTATDVNANTRVLKAGDTMTGQLNISSGGLLVTGNVGLGIASPTSNLHVIGTANVSANLTVGAGSAAAPAITTTGDNNTGIFFPAADTIAFAEGGVESLRIDANGRLGVGTTNPANNSILDLRNGGLNIGATGNLDAAIHVKTSFGGFDRITQMQPSTASKPGLNLLASTNASNEHQWWVWGVDANVWKLQPGTSFSGATGLFINSSGNVGVGVTNPSSPLTVNGGIAISSSTGNIEFANSGTTKRGVYGTMGDNDQWFIGGGATAGNAGFLEISTGDDGQTAGSMEQILVRQYGPGTPLTGTLQRTLTLLGASGETVIPVDIRAPIYYDSNNTGYYLDPNTTGVALRIAGAIQGDHVAWTGEHNKIQWHSDHMYFQNMNNGFWLFRRSNGSEPFRLHADGYGIASGDWRAPIFYDNNDTGFYCDPNSFSRFAGSLHVSVNNATGGGIILADDGDIVDLNDGFCAMRFSSGVRIHAGNRTGGANITLGSNGNITAAAFFYSSDITKKKNIQKINDGLEKICELKGVSFNWIETDRKDYGLIAQEVGEVIPEATSSNDDGTKNINSSAIIGYLVEAIKELKTALDNSNDKIKELEYQINNVTSNK